MTLEEHMNSLALIIHFGGYRANRAEAFTPEQRETAIREIANALLAKRGGAVQDETKAAVTAVLCLKQSGSPLFSDDLVKKIIGYVTAPWTGIIENTKLYIYNYCNSILTEGFLINHTDSIVRLKLLKKDINTENPEFNRGVQLLNKAVTPTTPFDPDTATEVEHTAHHLSEILKAIAPATPASIIETVLAAAAPASIIETVLAATPSLEDPAIGIGFGIGLCALVVLTGAAETPAIEVANYLS